jgi:putative transposase
MYARGMTTREIQGHLQEIYGVEVSPSLISEVTHAVIEELKARQSRPLEPLYPILFLDALMVKMRHEGKVENRAVYVAIGIDLDGRKDVLGLWTSANEGAKFWLQVLTELRNRGVKDVFIACVDGLKGFPQAIETVYPQARMQLCIAHLARAGLNYVNWKERKLVAQDLKSIYRAATVEQAEQEPAGFAERWDGKYPTISAMWQRNRDRVIPFFAFPAEIRKIVYTTNAVESLNMSLRKALKTRGAFPSEDAALKAMYLALRNVTVKWETSQHWKAALNRFTMLWEERIQISGDRMMPSPFALKILVTAGCGRRQGSAMNSFRSALTAVLAGQDKPISGRRRTTMVDGPATGINYEKRRLHKIADTTAPTTCSRCSARSDKSTDYALVPSENREFTLSRTSGEIPILYRRHQCLHFGAHQ